MTTFMPVFPHTAQSTNSKPKAGSLNNKLLKRRPTLSPAQQKSFLSIHPSPFGPFAPKMCEP